MDLRNGLRAYAGRAVLRHLTSHSRNDSQEDDRIPLTIQSEFNSPASSYQPSLNPHPSSSSIPRLSTFGGLHSPSDQGHDEVTQSQNIGELLTPSALSRPSPLISSPWLKSPHSASSDVEYFADLGKQNAFPFSPSGSNVPYSAHRPTLSGSTTASKSFHKRSQSSASTFPLIPSAPIPLSLRARKPWRKILWVWSPELAAAALCILAHIVAGTLLRVFGDKPTTSWHFYVSPNAIIAFLTTTSKSSLLLIFASCLGQWKWSHFKSPKSLDHLDLFDNASRGPWGSIRMLWRLKFTARPIVMATALLTLLTLTMEPFCQQILQAPLYSVDQGKDSSAAMSYVQFSTVDKTAIGEQQTQLVKHSKFPKGDNPMAGLQGTGGMPSANYLQSAIMAGLMAVDNSPPFTCPTGNCTFPTFSTLGICGSCQDVAKQANMSCIETIWSTMMLCRFKTPGGFSLTIYGQGDSPDNFVPVQPYPMQSRTAESWQRYLPGEHASINAPIAAFSALRPLGQPYFDKVLSPFPQEGSYEIHECAFYTCERTYPNAKVSAGTVQATPEFSLDRQLFATDYGRMVEEMNVKKWYQYLSVDESDLEDVDSDAGMVPLNPNIPSNKKLQYGITGIASLSDSLGTVFDNSDLWRTGLSDAGRKRYNALFSQVTSSPNISEVVRNVSVALTNAMMGESPSLSVTGSTFGVENRFQIRWQWYIPPTLLVVGGIFVLVIAILAHSTDNTPLWKTSSLALLLHDMNFLWRTHEARRHGYASWMESAATLHDFELEKLAQDYVTRLDYSNLEAYPPPDMEINPRAVSIGTFFGEERAEWAFKRLYQNAGKQPAFPSSKNRAEDV